MKKKILAVLLCMAFGFMLFSSAFAQEKEQKRPRRPRFPWKGPEIGTLIPDFELKLADGKSFKLSDQRGRIIVIELGACT